MSEEEPEEEKSRKGVGILIAVPLALLLYVLSAAPVAIGLQALPDKCQEPAIKVVGVIYAPVIWLMQNNKTFGTILMKEYVLMGGDV